MDALYDALAPLVGTDTLVFADENGVRAKLPYYVMRPTSFRQLGRDHFGDVNAQGIMPVTGDREFTLSLQRHGEGSVEALNTLVSRLRLITTQDRLRSLGLVFIRSEAVTNISALLDETEIEPRAGVDIMFRITSRMLDNVGIIENLELTGEGVIKNIPVVTIP